MSKQIKLKKSIIKILCQSCIDSYEGDHGKVKDILNNMTFIRKGHVECYVGTYEDYTIVTFRGSDGTSDWLDNFKAIKHLFWIDKKVAFVHYGFYEQFNTIKDELLKELKNRNDNKIIFTGHSLGGALATLAAYHYEYNVSFLGCVTFGSPRVGSSVFVDEFEKRVNYSIRYVYGEDTVCKVPTWWMGFRHVASKIRLGRTSFKEKLLFIPRKIFGNPFDHKPERYLANL
jgi:predicted lipase